LFDGENISFDDINRTNFHPIMIINRMYETQNPLYNQHNEIQEEMDRRSVDIRIAYTILV